MATSSRQRTLGERDLSSIAARVKPTSARQDRLLPLSAPLAPLFPGGGLQRGAVVAVDVGPPGAGGSTTLAFALLAAASNTGSWCAAVGTSDPGILAIAELGVDLERLVLVPNPGPAWTEVTATLLDGMEVVVTQLPWPVSSRAARLLAARTRERQAVLVVVGRKTWWPEGPEVRLEVGAGEWQGVGLGHGHLRGRRAEVVATGRRVATRPVSASLWLPAQSGALSPA